MRLRTGSRKHSELARPFHTQDPAPVPALQHQGPDMEQKRYESEPESNNGVAGSDTNDGEAECRQPADQMHSLRVSYFSEQTLHANRAGLRRKPRVQPA